ncbi:MAG: hypothetical protein H8E28_02305 [Anaerolineae bacterium]|nr:hypothetical protein [Anaerolineae bacterium]
MHPDEWVCPFFEVLVNLFFKRLRTLCSFLLLSENYSSREKMKTLKTRYSETNVDVKKLSFAFVGALLAYMADAFFMFFFMDAYARYAPNMYPLLVADQWGYTMYDNMPVKVFFGLLFIMAPVSAYLFAKISEKIDSFSLAYLAGGHCF